MRIDVSYLYIASFLINGGRKPVDLSFRSTVAIDISETESGKCPIVARLAGNAIRLIGGELFEALNPPNYARNSGEPQTFTMADFVAMVAVFPEAESFGIEYPRGRKPNALFPDRGCAIGDAPEVKKVLKDTSAEAEAKMHAWAAGIVSVDGVLFRKTDEPVLSLQISDGKGVFHATFAKLVPDYDDESFFYEDDSLFFNFGRREQAQEWCSKVFGADVVDGYPYEVYDRSVFHFNGDDTSLDGMAARFRSALRAAGASEQCRTELYEAFESWKQGVLSPTGLADAFEKSLDEGRELLQGKPIYASCVTALGIWRESNLTDEPAGVPGLK